MEIETVHLPDDHEPDTTAIAPAVGETAVENTVETPPAEVEWGKPILPYPSRGMNRVENPESAGVPNLL